MNRFRSDMYRFVSHFVAILKAISLFRASGESLLMGGLALSWWRTIPLPLAESGRFWGTGSFRSLVDCIRSIWEFGRIEAVNSRWFPKTPPNWKQNFVGGQSWFSHSLAWITALEPRYFELYAIISNPLFITGYHPHQKRSTLLRLQMDIRWGTYPSIIFL